MEDKKQLHYRNVRVIDRKFKGLGHSKVVRYVHGAWRLSCFNITLNLAVLARFFKLNGALTQLDAQVSQISTKIDQLRRR